MGSPYADWKKDGLDRLIKLAKTLCTLVSSFAHIIRSKYSDKPFILALLTAIEGVCALLPDAINEFDSMPSDDPLPPSDPSTLPGIDINAPDPPAIDTGV